eukprot:NODE_349_length_8994_cov_1.235526.p8 type:complete len:169 gc:universal NODE_349_length_8994_cov_1.235526:5979-6485(+)
MPNIKTPRKNDSPLPRPDDMPNEKIGNEKADNMDQGFESSGSKNDDFLADSSDFKPEFDKQKANDKGPELMVAENQLHHMREMSNYKNEHKELDSDSIKIKKKMEADKAAAESMQRKKLLANSPDDFVEETRLLQKKPNKPIIEDIGSSFPEDDEPLFDSINGSVVVY